MKISQVFFKSLLNECSKTVSLHTRLKCLYLRMMLYSMVYNRMLYLLSIFSLAEIQIVYLIALQYGETYNRLKKKYLSWLQTHF